MPEKIYHQIQYLCQQIPKVEWSGVLFYKVEGSIKDPKTMKIILEEILPMDKGNASYTEYTFDPSVVEHIMDNDYLEDCKIGHIHSHNTMSVFFSGTDMAELNDNAPNHNFYTSLIVNNFMNFCAKVCFVSKPEETEFVFYGMDEEGTKYEVEREKYVVPEKLMIYDCDIQVPSTFIEVQPTFMDKVKGIIQKAVSTVAPKNIDANKGYIKKDWTDWDTKSPTDRKDLKTTKPKYTVKELQEEIDSSGEELTMWVINIGNDISVFADLESICQFYIDQRVPASGLANKVIDTIVDSYNSFFSEYEDVLNTPGLFDSALDEVVFELAHFIQTTERVDYAELLKPSFLVLEGLKQKIGLPQ